MKIRSDIIRIYQSVHTWTGITSGFVLFIAFFAGALTMFKAPITEWAIPADTHLPQVELNEYDTLIQQAARAHENVIKGFTVSLEENQSPLFWYEQGGGRGISLNSVIRSASLNEHGEVYSSVSEQNVLGDLIDQLHRTAGIPGKVGHEDLGVVIMGIASALYFVALVSGVIFLLPTLVKSFFSLRQKKGASRFWLDTHNLLGITSLPFHLIIAWTVVVFAFHDVIYDGLDYIYGDEPMFQRGGQSSDVYPLSDLPAISSFIQKVNETTSGYRVKQLSFSNLDTERASVRIDVAGEGVLQRTADSDVILMHPFTQQVSYSTLSSDVNGGYWPLVKSLFALHFGNFAGTFGRWVYFFLGLMGAALFYTGNLLWLEKRRKKQAVQSTSNAVMANLTVGVCVGSMLGVAATLLSSKWMYIFGQPVNQSYLWVYFTVFLLALAYSFLKGAARSAIHLQLLLSLCCACIPVTTLISLVLPAVSWRLTASNLWIEATACIFAYVFFKGALKTRARALRGEKNSIWYIKDASVDSPSASGKVVPE